MPIADDRPAQRYVYVLELQGGRYYVGHTTTEKRIKKHFGGSGASWTKLYPPLAVSEFIDLGVISFNEAENIENQYTLRYMRRYGWRNVRGGFFSLTNETDHRKSLLSHKLRETLPVDFEIE